MKKPLAAILIFVLLAISGFSIVFAHKIEQIYALSLKDLAAKKPRNRTAPLILRRTDLKCESTDLISNLLYGRLSNSYKRMLPNGANNTNIFWEKKVSNRWFIEEQRYGEYLIVGGLLKNDPEAIEAGFKMFEWGFSQQAADGSFQGTRDAFHSTSFFVAAVARTLLVIKQSPQSDLYQDKVAYYTPLVRKAARWMISPDVWARGVKNNEPYTHRYYLVAAALGLTGKLTGDRKLIDYARQSIREGLALQRADGVNPEKGGPDSSYQMVGVVYASRWIIYFPQDRITPRVRQMIERALDWQETRILPTGEISSEGNTRTAGQERGRSGKVKKVTYNLVIRGFAYWGAVTGNKKWDSIARRIARYYHSS